jgi:hypothetical protein
MSPFFCSIGAFTTLGMYAGAHEFKIIINIIRIIVRTKIYIVFIKFVFYYTIYKKNYI